MKYYNKLIQIAALALIVPTIRAAAEMPKNAQPLKWTIGCTESAAMSPKEFYEATVPGAAPLDIAHGRKYPPLEYADNIKLLQKTEDSFFVYKANFPRIKTNARERLYFHSDSIDYRFDIKLNGKKILKQEGMFTPVDIDITDIAKESNEIEVVVYPAPKSRGIDAVFKKPFSGGKQF